MRWIIAILLFVCVGICFEQKADTLKYPDQITYTSGTTYDVRILRIEGNLVYFIREFEGAPRNMNAHLRSIHIITYADGTVKECADIPVSRSRKKKEKDYLKLRNEREEEKYGLDFWNGPYLDGLATCGYMDQINLGPGIRTGHKWHFGKGEKWRLGLHTTWLGCSWMAVDGPNLAWSPAQVGPMSTWQIGHRKSFQINAKGGFYIMNDLMLHWAEMGGQVSPELKFRFGTTTVGIEYTFIGTFNSDYYHLGSLTIGGQF